MVKTHRSDVMPLCPIQLVSLRLKKVDSLVDQLQSELPVIRPQYPGIHELPFPRDDQAVALSRDVLRLFRARE